MTGYDHSREVTPITADPWGADLDAQERRQQERAQHLADREKEILDQVRVDYWEKIPRRFRGIEAADDACLNWLSKPHDTLYMFGPVGAGKTREAWGLYARYLQDLTELPRGSNRYSSYRPLVAFWSLPKLMDALRPSSDSEARDRAMNNVLSASLLILDDLGTAKLSDWGQEQIFLIIDGRWNDMLPLVVTTNQRPGDLAEYTGAPVTSRIADGATIVEFKDDDHRKNRVQS